MCARVRACVRACVCVFSLCSGFRSPLSILLSFIAAFFIIHVCNRHSGSVVERPLCDREAAGSIPGRVIPKTFKMVLAALSFGAQH